MCHYFYILLYIFYWSYDLHILTFHNVIKVQLVIMYVQVVHVP